jgi:hypothetical protein
MTLRSITLPAPLPFRRDGYADVLAEHARLLTEHAGRLHTAARTFLRDDEELDMADHYAGRIVQGLDGRLEKVDVIHRPSMIRYFRAYRGIAGQLLLRPGSYGLYVVVAVGDAVSVHETRMERDKLIPAGKALVVEPAVQMHRKSGLGPLLVTRWLGPDQEARFGWVPIPSRPASPEEGLARLHARYETRVLEETRARLRPDTTDPLVVLRSDSQGDSLNHLGRNLAFVALTGYPGILEALAQGKQPGRVPVVADMGMHACLRWLDLDPVGTTAPGSAELVEAFRWPPEIPTDGGEETEEEEDYESWIDFGPRAPRKPSAAEVLREIERSACFGEVDQYLGAMSDEELDRAIAAAGFDPKAERARGAGVREKVVAAILDARLDAEGDA